MTHCIVLVSWLYYIDFLQIILRLKMNILLHPDKDGGLSEHYKRAFGKAIELFIVTAYLTEWDSSLILNSNCKDFRVIIGKDFGITRKAACESVMKWLPSERKNQFLVVDMISGFHPKAVFWKESSENYFTIIGSSNLTNAAFNTNFEANAFSSISKDEYNAAKRWVRDIEKLSVIVSEDWLLQYKESTPIRGISRVKSNKNNTKNDKIQLIAFKLPRPKNIDKLIKERRKQLDAYNKNSADIIKLFRECADRKIESDDFYNEISKYWSYEEGNRLQGAGWERTGRDSNFMLLSQSYINIFNALPDDRDNVVIKEIDRYIH